MQLETLEEVRSRLAELRREIEEEIGETDKPLHAEAAIQEFPGETRSNTAMYRKLHRAEKLLEEAQSEGTEAATERLEDASKVLRKEDQAHISEEGFEELKEFAEKIDQEREKITG